MRVSDRLAYGLSRLRDVRWSGLRVLALLVAALGAWGVLSTIGGLAGARRLAGELISNPVFGNERRLEAAQALDQLTRDFSGNFVTLVVVVVFMVVLSVHFFGLLRSLYRYASLETLVAGLFLGASILSGVFIVLTALKVNEFALQATVASAEEQTWLRGGISFLNQIHLIFVYGWFLLTGLGWVFVGAGALRVRGWIRGIGGVELLAGLLAVTALFLRGWLPSYGVEVPALMVFSSDQLSAGGMALGFLASGMLAWSLGGPKSRLDCQAEAGGAVSS